MAVSHVTHEHHSEAWHAERAMGIGGSDVAVAAGLSKWHSPYSWWLERTGRIKPEPTNDAMQLGLDLEPALARMWERETGLVLGMQQAMVRHPVFPQHRATVDGLGFDHSRDLEPSMSDAVCVGELKVTGDAPWDEIPAYYQCQGQWQMWVTGLDLCIFGALHLLSRRFITYELRRSDLAIAALVDAADWLLDCVRTDTPPPVDAHRETTRAIAERWPQHEPDSEVALDHLEPKLRRIVAIDAEVKALEDEQALLKNEVKDAMGEAEAGTVAGRTVATWKTQTARTVDLDALRESEPDIAERFTVPKTQRKFLTKKKELS